MPNWWAPTAPGPSRHNRAGPPPRESVGPSPHGSKTVTAEIDDLVQEAFFRAFSKLETWREEASFRSWLLRIGGNLLKDQVRRRRGVVAVPIEDHDVTDGSDPAGEVRANEMEERLVDALGRLPRLQREVFVMRVQQGLEYSEICDALGTTPGAARVHYHHAVKRLKESVQ
ncbi:MAG: sigma-70 family RNA polymerase sigma factor [Gemmatimonadales bacterium]